MTHQHERREDNFSGEEAKTMFRKVLKEWLDEKLAEFGWFSIKTIFVLVFTALVYFALTQSGWHHGAVKAVERIP